jgi:F-type H+-transporting ATPase subunit gamma
MKQSGELAKEEASMATLVELTGAFEGIASMRIAQVKDQVLQSTKFYHQLWAIYSQIQAGNPFSFGRSKSDKQVIPKELLIIITAEGGFSGDIDQKLVKLMLESYDPAKNDIIVIGHHGVQQLTQAQVAYKKYYKLPVHDRGINVTPLVQEMKQYESTKVYYQSYVSLMVQEVRHVAMSTAVNERGESSDKPEEVINDATYIFEPSTFEVISHLERSMMQIALSQLILESKLAQYASRFQAMTMAHNRADENRRDLHLDYNRAKRAQKDERLKEIVNGIKKSKLAART